MIFSCFTYKLKENVGGLLGGGGGGGSKGYVAPPPAFKLWGGGGCLPSPPPLPMPMNLKPSRLVIRYGLLFIKVGGNKTHLSFPGSPSGNWI